MSDYCNNCGRRSHCGTSLNEVLEPCREGDGTPLIKICDKCRCDQCIENENRYSDERILLKLKVQKRRVADFNNGFVINS